MFYHYIAFMLQVDEGEEMVNHLDLEELEYIRNHDKHLEMNDRTITTSQHSSRHLENTEIKVCI